MVPGGWLGNLMSSYEWTGIGDELKIDGFFNLFVDQVNFLGISTIGDSWVFRGSLAAPPNQLLLCCLHANCADHHCAKPNSGALRPFVELTMDVGFLPVQQCGMISEMSLLSVQFEGSSICPLSSLMPSSVLENHQRSLGHSIDSAVMDSTSGEVDGMSALFQALLPARARSVMHPCLSVSPVFVLPRSCSMRLLRPRPSVTHALLSAETSNASESVSSLRLPAQGAGHVGRSGLCPALVLPEGSAMSRATVQSVKVLQPCGSQCLHPCADDPQVQVLRFHVVPACSMVLPKATCDDKLPWFHLELFAGGFGGWKQAAAVLQSQLNVRMQSLAVEIDHDIAGCYAKSFGVPVCFWADDIRLNMPVPFFGPFPHDDIMFVGDVAEKNWVKLVPWATRVVCTMSSPCTPWSRASDRDGLHDPAGRSLVEAIANLRLVRPLLVVMENVDSFRCHPHFQGILDCMKWAGYKLGWESIEDLKDITPVSRKRWLAVFVPTDSPQNLVAGCGFIPLPSCNLGSLKTLIELPESHERDLTLSEELLAIYANPKYMTKGCQVKRSLNDEIECSNQVLRQRLRGALSFLATFVAQYGNQHNLPASALEKRGLFTELFMGRFGIRFFSPFEIAILHGVCAPLCLPKEHGHLIVGNCVAIQHALLALVAGLSMFDARFHVNRCVINEICLLSRLHGRQCRDCCER